MRLFRWRRSLALTFWCQILKFATIRFVLLNASFEILRHGHNRKRVELVLGAKDPGGDFAVSQNLPNEQIIAVILPKVNILEMATQSHLVKENGNAVLEIHARLTRVVIEKARVEARNGHHGRVVGM